MFNSKSEKEAQVLLSDCEQVLDLRTEAWLYAEVRFMQNLFSRAGKSRGIARSEEK